MEYNSIAIGRAALRLAITESREAEQELRKQVHEQGIRSVAVDFGGQFVPSIPKIIEHAVVAAQRQRVVADNHIGEGAVIGATQEALEQLDPAQLLGGSLNMSDHLMLTAVIGAAVIGIGTGIVVRNQATTGGSDIVGMLLQKYAHIRFSNAILLVDGTVVCFGLVVIGFGIGSAEDVSQPSWHLSLYSLISIFIISRVIAYMINGAKNDKLIFVISQKHQEALRQYILKDLDRTATYIKSSGLYTQEDKEMIFLVVSYKEVTGIKLKIKEVDPDAFVVVTDAYDTFGAGWKELPSPNDVQPE